MNTSSEFSVELGTADEFVRQLQKLTCQRLGELAYRVEEVRATTGGDVEWWRATAAVSRRLRLLHRSRAAAVVALRASEAVLGSPGAAELPRDALVQAARAAGDVARVLVAKGPPFALDVFTSAWEDVVGAVSPPPRPSARLKPGQLSKHM
jgi:hypothetical protein